MEANGKYQEATLNGENHLRNAAREKLTKNAESIFLLKDIDLLLL